VIVIKFEDILPIIFKDVEKILSTMILIFDFLIAPYNILYLLKPSFWTNAIFYERIILAIGFGTIITFLSMAILTMILIIYSIIFKRKIESATEMKIVLVISMTIQGLIFIELLIKIFFPNIPTFF